MLNRLKRSLTLRPRFWLTGGVCTGLAMILLVSGCGSSVINDAIPDQRLAYKKQQEASENLEIPPDLTAGKFDDALDIPPAGGARPTRNTAAVAHSVNGLRRSGMFCPRRRTSS